MESYFGIQKSWKIQKTEFILSIFALLPWIRKPATQTMTKVEGYHITEPSALQMKLCVFACCSATEQQGQRVLCKAVGIWSFLRKEKETFCKVQTPFAWWKMCSNCHNHVLKINLCQSLKLLLLDIFWFFDKWKWWRRRKWWREVGYTSLYVTIFCVVTLL